MAEITLKLEIPGFKKEKLEELEKDIKLFMRFKLARDALLKEWEKGSEILSFQKKNA